MMIYAAYGKKLLWGAVIFLAAIIGFEVFLSFRGGKPIGTPVNAVIVQNLSGDEVTVKATIDNGETKTVQLPAGEMARIVDSVPNSDERMITLTGSVRERDGSKSPISLRGDGVILELNKDGFGSLVAPLSRKTRVLTDPAVVEWTGTNIGTVALEIERLPKP